jgi:hypothetical protein
MSVALAVIPKRSASLRQVVPEEVEDAAFGFGAARRLAMEVGAVSAGEVGDLVFAYELVAEVFGLSRPKAFVVGIVISMGP